MTYEELAKKVYEKSPEKLMEIGEEAFKALENADRRKYTELFEKLEDACYTICKEEAEEMVYKMSPYGQKWSNSQVRSVLEQHGESIEKLINWYLVLNMMYNDYRNTAEMFGLSEDTEFYYNLAHDFIYDMDAKSHKVEKYFMTD